MLLLLYCLYKLYLWVSLSLGWRRLEKKERGYYLDELEEREWVHFEIVDSSLHHRSTAGEAAQTHKNKVVLVGINYARTRYELHGCINDALNMRELVLSRGVDQNSIVFATDNTKALLPTYDNLLSFYQQMVSTSEPGDRLLCYYSGHGVSVRQSSGVISECICPLSNNRKPLSTMTDDVLFSVLEPTLAKKPDVHLLFIADCCFSEGLLNSAWVYIPDKDGVTIREMKNRFGRITPAKMQLLSGATSFQPTMDVGGQSVIPHGAFTNCFLRFMNNHQSQSVTYRELILGVHGCVKQGKFKQVMCFGSSYQLNLDDPFLFP